MCEVIQEIRLTGQYKLNKENEELKQQIENQSHQLENKTIETNKIISNNYLVSHNKFLEIFNDKKVVYVILLRQDINLENDIIQYIIKIGKTENLSRRLKEISAEYMIKEPMIIDAYETNDILKLEYRIHNTEFIKKLHYKYITIFNKVATETYSMNENEIKDLKIIIKDLINNLPSENKITKEQIYLKELELKNNEIKLKIIEKINETKSNEMDKKLIDIKTEILNEIINEVAGEPKQIIIQQPAPPIIIQSRTITANRIPEIYQYHPSDLTTPIKKYNSPIDLARENPNVVLNSLRNAITNNTIYIDYRWIYVNRNENPPEIILPTKTSIIKSHNNPTHIARLNITKTKIIMVYASSREAIDDMEKIMQKQTKTHSFARAIKTGGLQFSFCWNYFSLCSEELQNEYLSHSTLPQYTNPLGNCIVKVCPNTNNIVEIFSSKIDVAKKCGISTKSLNKILDMDTIYNGFIWKYQVI